MARMNPWEIAKALGIGYSGDMDPIRHGGFFYDYSNWVRWGYCSIIEFWEDPEDDSITRVTRGVINRPDDLSGAFACCGISSPDDKNNVLCQIDCVRAYCGYEPDETLAFYVESTSARTVWANVKAWIEELEANDD